MDAATGKSNESRPVVPELRFPEFRERGEWANRRLGELICLITPPKKLSTMLYAASGDFPIIDQSVEPVCGWTDDIDAIIDKGSPLIVFGDHTCSLKLVDRPFAQGADGIKVFSGRSEIVTDFLYQSLLNYPLVMEDYRRHFAVLKERVVAFPDIESGEQGKIAECLSSLDAVIAAEGERLAMLRNHKKGLMQALFPTEGQTTPRLRFPEFRDSGEWNLSNLPALATVQSGSTPAKANAAFWDGDIPWVSAKDMKSFFLDDAEDHISASAVKAGTRLVPAGSLFILTRGMTLLKDIPVCVIRREMSFNQDVKALRPKANVNSVFLALSLVASKSRLLAMVDIAGHGTGALNTDKLAAFYLAFPEQAEQQAISNCLLTLDAQITVASVNVV